MARLGIPWPGTARHGAAGVARHGAAGQAPARGGRAWPGVHAVSSADGERELATGLLSKDVTFRLIVSGRVGEKEIERLIRKLQLDKEILAEADEERGAACEHHEVCR